MPGCVVDANATITWLFKEERTQELPEDFSQYSFLVPWLWRVEVTNVILVAERRKRITASQGTRFLQILDALEVDVVGESLQRPLETLAHLARPHQLRAYDALYLEIALSSGLPLCTFDNGLRDAAKRLDVELVVERA